MNTIRSACVNGFLVGLGLLAAISASAQAEGPALSTVVRLSGGARASVDGKKWKTLKLGDLLTQGTWVQTARGADLDILIGEQVKPAKGSFYNPEVRPANFVSLSADTVLKLDKVLTKAGDSPGTPAVEVSLELRKGAVSGNVKKTPAPSMFEFALPGAVAGMREGVFKAIAPGQFQVLKGSAMVALTDGKTVTEVLAGHELNAGTGAVGPASAEPALKLEAAPPPSLRPQAPPATPQPNVPPPAPLPTTPKSNQRKFGA